MDSAVIVLVLLLAFGGGGSKPAKKLPPEFPPPDEQCPDGQPVVYDGPKLYGDVRKSDKAAGMTPAEQTFMSNILTDIGDEEGLVLAPGLCTKELLRSAMQMPGDDNSWDSLLAMLVYGQASGKGIPKWPLLSQQQRERVGMLTMRVLAHHKPAADSDLEDEASDVDGPRGSVSEDVAVAWTVANQPTQTPPSWSIPAPHNKQKQGQPLRYWYANYAFYFAYPTAPPKILLPQHWAWVGTYNRVLAKVDAAMS